MSTNVNTFIQFINDNWNLKNTIYRSSDMSYYIPGQSIDPNIGDGTGPVYGLPSDLFFDVFSGTIYVRTEATPDPWEILSKDPLNIPEENGESIISKDGEVKWIKNEIRFTGDIHHTIPTEITRFSNANDTESIKIFLTVKGIKTGTKGIYSSNIIVSKENETTPQINEYGIINSNDLDITFNTTIDSGTNEWVITLLKNDIDYEVQEIILKVQVMDFV